MLPLTLFNSQALYNRIRQKRRRGAELRLSSPILPLIKRFSQSFPEQNENAMQDGRVSFFSFLSETLPLPIPLGESDSAVKASPEFGLQSGK